MSKIYNENLSWEIPSETKDELPEHSHTFQLNLNLLSALKNEQQLLLGKMRKAMEDDNVGTYKNLVQALREITNLVQNEERAIKYEKAYIEVDRDSAYMYFRGEKLLVRTNSVDVMVNIIKSKLKDNREMPIYIDIRTVGLAVYDSLKSEGFNVLEANIDIVNIN